MARATYVKKARKDYPDENISKGDSYYWWKFRYGRKIRSKTAPTRQQLTNSAFLSEMYGIEDEIAVTSTAKFVEVISSVTSQLENLGEECQDKLDNMPEQLQETSSSGVLLQERVDAIDEMVSELESIDTDYSEEQIKIDSTSEYLGKKKLTDLNEEEKEELEEKIEEAIEDRRTEIADEISGVCYNGG